MENPTRSKVFEVPQFLLLGSRRGVVRFSYGKLMISFPSLILMTVAAIEVDFANYKFICLSSGAYNFLLTIANKKHSPVLVHSVG